MMDWLDELLDVCTDLLGDQRFPAYDHVRRNARRSDRCPQCDNVSVHTDTYPWTVIACHHCYVWWRRGFTWTLKRT